MKKGLGYERKVVKALTAWNNHLPVPGELHAGQWMQFSDNNGSGWAQSDCYIVFPHLLLLVECKLTQTDEAHYQLLGLYYPLLRHIYARQIVCVQACHNLREKPRRKLRHPEDLVLSPKRGVWTWHYLG